MNSLPKRTPVPSVQTIGPYRLGRQLGRGGMGEVYEAQHRMLGRTVAIKRLHRASPSNIDRFFAEARLAASIQHRGIVEVFDLGVDHCGLPYLVMERLYGADLALALIRKRRFSEAEVIEVAIQAASALAAAHARGIVHRDLKPENLYLADGTSGGLGEVKILDFGVAKARDSALTDVGQLLGTPQYMAPEQYEGAESVDARCDIYSLGCILFEMATGRAPYEGRGAEVIAKHQRAPVPRVRDAAPNIGRPLAAIIEGALAKNPDDRPNHAGVLLKQLVAIRPDRRRSSQRMPAVSTPKVRHAASRLVLGLATGLAATAIVAAIFHV